MELTPLALKNLPKYWEFVNDGANTYIRCHKFKDPAKELHALKYWALEYDINLISKGVTSWYNEKFDGEIWNLFLIHADPGDSETLKIQDKSQGLKCCRSCYRTGLTVAPVSRISSNGATLDLCADCVKKCKACDVLIPKQEAITYGIESCSTCSPTFKCSGCNRRKNKDVGQDIALYTTTGAPLYEGKRTICETCFANICTSCDKVFHRGVVLKEVGDEKLCPICIEERMLKDFEKLEKFRLEELPQGGLTVSSLSSRPFRTISIETEVDGNRHIFAKTLYKSGIVRYPEVEGYGTRTPDTSTWPAFLKHDGSVTGGELISFMLELNKREHAESLKTTLRKLRALELSGIIEFNPNCGGHIHIDATGFSQANVWRLLTIWNYVEDFTFRLAGSGHKYGHRTLVPGHDIANRGRGYSHPTVKGPWGLKSTAAQAFGAQDRMCGLNFQPYLGAIRNCLCDAVINDKWDKCKCELPKCTIEWRVWNSQRNPRILHAWIAYMQAMHAAADDIEPDVNWETKHPALAWTKLPYNKTTDAHRKLLRERIEWLFANLILTGNERDSLVYAIKNSDIPVSTADERQWLSIKGPSLSSPYRKAPRVMVCAPRNRKIVCKPPDPNEKALKEKTLTYNIPPNIFAQAYPRERR